MKNLKYLLTLFTLFGLINSLFGMTTNDVVAEFYNDIFDNLNPITFSIPSTFVSATMEVDKYEIESRTTNFHFEGDIYNKQQIRSIRLICTDTFLEDCNSFRFISINEITGSVYKFSSYRHQSYTKEETIKLLNIVIEKTQDDDLVFADNMITGIKLGHHIANGPMAAVTTTIGAIIDLMRLPYTGIIYLNGKVQAEKVKTFDTSNLFSYEYDSERKISKDVSSSLSNIIYKVLDNR